MKETIVARGWRLWVSCLVATLGFTVTLLPDPGRGIGFLAMWLGFNGVLRNRKWMWLAALVPAVTLLVPANRLADYRENRRAAEQARVAAEQRERAAQDAAARRKLAAMRPELAGTTAGAPREATPAPGLGASRAAFVAKYGAALRESARTADYGVCSGTNLAQWSIMFEGDRASLLTRNACAPGTLSVAGAEADAKVLFPADAVGTGQFRSSDGWPAKAYRSKSLATQLPAKAFADCSGKVDAGTFFYLLSPEHNFWAIGAGRCP